MANRYTTPGKHQYRDTYIPQHVGLPFEAIRVAQQSREQEFNYWNEGVTGVDSGLMGAQVLPGPDAEYLKGVQKQYHQALTDLSSTDLSRPENQKQAQFLVQQLASDQGFQKAQMSQRNAATAQAQWQELDKKGQGWKPQARSLARKLAAYNQGGGAQAGLTFEGGDFTPVQDHVGNADKIMKVLHANEVESLRGLAAEGGDIAYNIKQAGISGDQVRKAVAGAAQQWLTSLDGQQLAQMGEEEALDKGASPEQAQQYGQQVAVKFLYDRGMASTYSSSSTGIAGALNTRRKEGLAKKAKEEDKAAATSRFMMPDAKTQFTYQGEWDEQGGIKGDGTFDPGAAWDKVKQGDISGAWSSVFNSNISEEQKKKWEPVIKGTAKANAILAREGKAPLTMQQYAENFTGLTKNTNSAVQRWESGKQVEDATKAWIDNDGVGIFSGADVRLTGTDNDFQTMSGADAYEKVTKTKLTPEAIKEKGGVRISGPAQVTEEGYEQPITIGNTQGFLQLKSAKDLASPTINNWEQSREYNLKLAEKKGYHSFKAYDPIRKKVVDITGSRNPISGAIEYDYGN